MNQSILQNSHQIVRESLFILLCHNLLQTVTDVLTFRTHWSSMDKGIAGSTEKVAAPKAAVLPQKNGVPTPSRDTGQRGSKQGKNTLANPQSLSPETPSPDNHSAGSRSVGSHSGKSGGSDATRRSHATGKSDVSRITDGSRKSEASRKSRSHRSGGGGGKNVGGQGALKFIGEWPFVARKQPAGSGSEVKSVASERSGTGGEPKGKNGREEESDDSPASGRRGDSSPSSLSASASGIADENLGGKLIVAARDKRKAVFAWMRDTAKMYALALKLDEDAVVQKFIKNLETACLTYMSSTAAHLHQTGLHLMESSDDLDATTRPSHHKRLGQVRDKESQDRQDNADTCADAWINVGSSPEERAAGPSGRTRGVPDANGQMATPRPSFVPLDSRAPDPLQTPRKPSPTATQSHAAPFTARRHWLQKASLTSANALLYNPQPCKRLLATHSSFVASYLLLKNNRVESLRSSQSWIDRQGSQDKDEAHERPETMQREDTNSSDAKSFSSIVPISSTGEETWDKGEGEIMKTADDNGVGTTSGRRKKASFSRATSQRFSAATNKLQKATKRYLPDLKSTHENLLADEAGHDGAPSSRVAPSMRTTLIGGLRLTYDDLETFAAVLTDADEMPLELDAALKDFHQRLFRLPFNLCQCLMLLATITAEHATRTADEEKDAAQSMRDHLKEEDTGSDVGEMPRSRSVGSTPLAIPLAADTLVLKPIPSQTAEDAGLLVWSSDDEDENVRTAPPIHSTSLTLPRTPLFSQKTLMKELETLFLEQQNGVCTHGDAETGPVGSASSRKTDRDHAAQVDEARLELTRKVLEKLPLHHLLLWELLNRLLCNKNFDPLSQQVVIRTAAALDMDHMFANCLLVYGADLIAERLEAVERNADRGGRANASERDQGDAGNGTKGGTDGSGGRTAPTQSLATTSIGNLKAFTTNMNKMKVFKIAGMAVGVGALSALTAGLAAPSFAAGLGALGIAGTSGFATFLGSAGGAASLASIFGASSASLSGWKYSRRLADIRVFEFIRISCFYATEALSKFLDEAASVSLPSLPTRLPSFHRGATSPSSVLTNRPQPATAGAHTVSAPQESTQEEIASRSKTKSRNETPPKPSANSTSKRDPQSNARSGPKPDKQSNPQSTQSSIQTEIQTQAIQTDSKQQSENTDHHPPLALTVGVCGWLKDAEDATNVWSRSRLATVVGSELLALRWEPQLLSELGGMIVRIVGENMAVSAASLSVQITMAASASFIMWPVSFLQYAGQLDNTWMTCRERSQQAGLLLAAALCDENLVGHRPVTLVGYSVGARVIVYALRELYNRGEFNRVQNAILMGTPCSKAREHWRRMRAVVADRLVNVYCTSDWILVFLYRYMEWGLKVAGLSAIDGVAGVENYDCTSLVFSHNNYDKRIPDILAYIGFHS